MKQIVLIAFLLFGLSSFSADTIDFSFTKDLSGWTRSGKNASFDPVVKISKTGSVKLTTGGSVSKKLTLEPGAEYVVSVYIKADRVTGKRYKGVLLRLTDGINYYAVTGDKAHLPRQGTFDWTKCSRVIKSSFFKKSEIFVMPVLTGNGTAWFDEIRIVKKKSTEKSKFFRQSFHPSVENAVLIPGGVSGFFNPGQEAYFRFMVKSSAQNLEYEAVVKDENGKIVYRIPRRPLVSGFKIPGQHCGYYVVEAELYANGIKGYYLQSAFAVNQPLQKRDPFFQFGYGVYSKMIPSYKRIGAGSIVLKVPILQSPGIMKLTPETIYNKIFLKDYKPFLDTKNFELCISVGCTLPSSFRSEEEIQAGWPLQSDQTLQHLLNCVDHIHKNTKDTVREWTIGCEIPSNATGGSKRNLCNTWTEAMFNMMIRTRMISRRLKGPDPTLKIFAGGNNRQEFTNTIERIVMSDLVDDFDGYVIDAYTGNWNMILGQHVIPELRLMEFYRNASDLSFSLGKGKIIRNDETGYAIHHGACFNKGLAVEQACLTARTIILTKASPVSRFELHMPVYYSDVLKNPKDDTICMTTVWKPVYFDNTFHNIPLPGASMYATAAAELSFVKFLTEIKNGNIYCYLFQKPDGSVLITLWNIAEKQKFICRFPDKGTKAVNMYGRAIPPQDPVISTAPIYITTKMQQEKAVAMMKKTVMQNTPEFKCTASADKIYIQSFAIDTRVCKLRFPGQNDLSVKLYPGRVNEIAMIVKTNGTLLAQDGRSYDIPLKKIETYSISKINFKPVFNGSGEWLKGLPAGELKYPDHIRPAEALQPERRYFRSNFNPNGHNISARYWTAYDAENFYFAVKVDDPKHQQRKKADSLWQDDSIQFVLSHEPACSSFANSGPKPKSEYNFGLALTPEGTVLVKYLGKDHGLMKYPAKVTRTGDTTFYEVAIPWKAINGKASRFGFIVFNNDWSAVNSAPYHLDFTAGIAGGADDTKLKVLKYLE